MADAKLTALTAASALAAADLSYVSQSAASRKATGTQLLALVGTTYVPLAGGTMTGPLISSSSLSGSNFYVNPNGNIGFNTPATGFLFWDDSGDVRLYRDAAATLAQRNGTTAQAFKVYNTYTDASNGEWGTFGWSSNELLISSAKIGTGFNRSTRILSALDLYLYTSNGGDVLIGGNSTAVLRVQYNRTLTAYPFENTNYTQMTEMTAPSAPATNAVRIYAEDNGAGKTRLMALFATGAAQQISIEP